MFTHTYNSVGHATDYILHTHLTDLFSDKIRFSTRDVAVGRRSR